MQKQECSKSKSQSKSTLKLNLDDLEMAYIPDVVYASFGTCERRLQLIVPSRFEWTKEEKFPLLLFVPGSAGYEQEYLYKPIPELAKIADRGIVIAVLQYRESSIAHFPAQIQDAKAAVRFLVTKAEEYHIDTDRIYLSGHSSGAHTALLTALTKAGSVFESELYPDVDYEIQGVIAQSAPSNILISGDNQPEMDMLGISSIKENEELARTASCDRYISKDSKIPPILMFHGTNDELVSVEHSRHLYEELQQNGKDVSYYEIENAFHGGAFYWRKEIIDIMCSFIKQ